MTHKNMNKDTDEECPNGSKTHRSGQSMSTMGRKTGDLTRGSEVLNFC